MKKYIFLDVDGVINLKTQYNAPAKDHFEDFVYRFDRRSLSFLHDIWQWTNAEIVLSAACRKIPQYREAIFAFMKENYGIKMHRWTGSASDGFRGEEVLKFLKEEKELYGLEGIRYAIIDDESDFYLEQRPFLFQTDPEYGITENIAYRVRYALNNGFEDTRRLGSDRI